jgi:ubiquinone/menaquinone biosynthesis C-methylase UbiE
MSKFRALRANDVWLDAGAYDRWFDTPWGSYATGIETRAVLRALGGIEGATVVDIGCGTGRLAAELRAAGAHSVGVDREPAMLNVARGRNASLVASDAHALPLRDLSVDVALAVTVLEFVADPAAAFAELVRVVRPGGRILVGALNPHSAWGIAHRHDFTEPPWNEAHFLTRTQLRALGSPYGRVKLFGALYSPGMFPLHEVIAPILEWIGRAMPGLGAFRTLIIEKQR